MADIENLEIKITSVVGPATRSINTLINKLGSLNKSISSLNTSNLNGLSSTISNLANATSRFSNVDPSAIKSVASALNKINSVSSANINSVAASAVQLSKSLGSLNGADMNNGLNNLNVAMKNLRKFGGVKISTASTNLPQLTTSLQQLTSVLNTVDSSKIADFASVTQAISKLGGKYVSTAVSQLPQLTQQLELLFQSLARAPAVSTNTVQALQAISQLKGSTASLTNQTGNVKSFFSSYSSYANNATKKSKSLASTIGKVYASYWMLFRIFNKLGNSVSYASSLIEVQNVIDTSFGKYTEGIEKLAENSIDTLGISELATKQIAGRFQAMGTAMGIPRKQMAEMSTDLTTLAADIGSFYDIDTDDVAEKLESIFTGQTKPLRQLGVDISEVNLKEYALANGMDADIESMTQAEKAMLRYQYVLNATKSAQGDYLKTQNSWANQTRKFSNNLQNIGSQIGSMIIYTFKPALIQLNNALAITATYANKVLNALGNIFGWEIEDYNKGIVDETDYTEDLSDSLDTASDSAKELKKQLQGFDELNNLTSSSSSDSGSGSGTSSSTSGSYDDSSYKKKTDAWESDINSLYDLGKDISDALKESLESINWDDVYSGAIGFGTGLANFLNGLFQPDTFATLGSTIAKTLNTAIYEALAFGETFDFENAGDCIAEGINSFFDDYDFTALAKTLNVWAKGLRDAFTKAVTNIKWDNVIAGAFDFLSELELSTVVTLIGLKFLLGGGVKTTALAALKTLIGKEISSPQLALIATVGFLSFKLGEQLAKNKFISDITDDIVEWLYDGGDSIKLDRALAIAIPAVTFSFVGAKVLSSLGSALAGAIGGATAASASGAAGAAASLAGASAATGAFSAFISSIGTLLTSDITMFGAATFAEAAGAIFTSFVAALGAAFGGWTFGQWLYENNYLHVGDAADYVVDKTGLGKFAVWIDENILNPDYDDYNDVEEQEAAREKKKAQEESKQKVEEAGNQLNAELAANGYTWAKDSGSKAGQSWLSGFSETAKTGWGKNLASVSTYASNNSSTFSTTMNGVGKTGGNSMVDGVNTGLYNSTKWVTVENTLKNKGAAAGKSGLSSSTLILRGDDLVKGLNTGLYNSSNWVTIQNNLSSKAKEAGNNGLTTSTLSGRGSSLVSGLNSGVGSTSWWNNIKSTLTSKVQAAGNNGLTNTTLKTKGSTLVSGINTGAAGSGYWTTLQNGLKTHAKTAGNNSLTTSTLNSNGKYLVQGIFTGASEEAKSTESGNAVANVANIVKNWFKSKFKINSPSRLMRDEIGVYLPQGITAGIEKGTPDLLKSVNVLSDDMTYALEDGLDFSTPIQNAMLNATGGTLSSNIQHDLQASLDVSNNSQNALLVQQNDLLLQILQKETGIKSSDVFRACRAENKKFYDQTGNNALVY